MFSWRHGQGDVHGSQPPGHPNGAAHTSSVEGLVSTVDDLVAKSEQRLDPAAWVDRHGDYLFRYALSRLRDVELLGNSSGAIPFYAIFPAGDPNKPILLDGLLTSPEPIVDALRRAGPSKDTDRQVAVR